MDWTSKMPNNRDLMDAVRRNVGTKAGFAWTMFETLKAQVKEFESGLTEGEETAAWLANFGSGITVTVTGIGYKHPHLIVLKGEDEQGRSVELLQHVSQVSLLLVPVPVRPDQLPRRIGFLADAKTRSDE